MSLVNPIFVVFFHMCLLDPTNVLTRQCQKRWQESTKTFAIFLQLFPNIKNVFKRFNNVLGNNLVFTCIAWVADLHKKTKYFVTMDTNKYCLYCDKVDILTYYYSSSLAKLWMLLTPITSRSQLWLEHT